VNDCISFQKWRKQLGISKTTGWRWEHDGKIATFQIYGRKYVLLSEIERFLREGAKKKNNPPMGFARSKRSRILV
jgi:predicted site-specific integrase-resolvase